MDPDYVPDLKLTSPVFKIGPYPSWSDPKKISGMFMFQSIYRCRNLYFLEMTHLVRHTYIHTSCPSFTSLLFQLWTLLVTWLLRHTKTGLTRAGKLKNMFWTFLSTLIYIIWLVQTCHRSLFFLFLMIYDNVVVTSYFLGTFVLLSP